MAERRIVITGANSYLGQALVSHLSRDLNIHITGFVSPRADGTKLTQLGGQVSFIKADLVAPLPEEARDALANADNTFHLAWQRGTDVAEVVDANLAMIENLITHIPETRRFVFFSSVAALDQAPSNYGIAKSRAENLVIQRGGTVLVCGLVVDHNHPGTAYQVIHNLVCNLPIDIRFLGAQPRIYIIALADLLEIMKRFLVEDEWPELVGLFVPNGIPLGELLLVLKKACPRMRIPVPMHANLVRGFGRVMYATPWRATGERLTTFFFDNSERLKDLDAVPMSDLPSTKQFLRA